MEWGGKELQKTTKKKKRSNYTGTRSDKVWKGGASQLNMAQSSTKNRGRKKGHAVPEALNNSSRTQKQGRQ